MKQIAVAGKGGTGKTTFAALLIRYLIKKGNGPVFAVDADPNSNLSEALGIEVQGETISQLIDKTKELDGIPQGMDQHTFIEYKLNSSLAESKDVDLIVMGGPEGPGCYCFPNNVLRKYLDNMSKSYPYMVVDNEAGLEHISRRTTKDVDIMFVISDNSARSIRSAGRIKDLLTHIKTKVKEVYLVVTKTHGGDISGLEEEIQKTGLDLIGVIPFDKLLMDFDVHSKPLFQLPDDSIAVKAVEQILDKVKL